MAVECDSFPVLRKLSQGLRPCGGPAFSAHSWLYCRSNIGYQAAGSVTLPPYFAGREPA